MKNPSTLKPYNTNVQQMFNNIASHYDFLNHFLSFGIDKIWRRKAIKLLIPYKPTQILDVATGTGDFAIAAIKLNPQKITAIDIAETMLEIAKYKIKKKNLGEKIAFITGSSESIPFTDKSFDAVTVAFGVRNFKDLKMGLSEILRVLNEKGVAVILEFSRPAAFPFKQIYLFYFRWILPLIGKMISKDNMAYTYLFETVMNFPQGDDFAVILKQVGFSNVRIYKLSFGICSIYIAEK